MKIVVNRTWGGFGITKEMAQFMAGRGCEHAKKCLDNQSYEYGYHKDYEEGYSRTNPHLVAAIEHGLDNPAAALVVVEVPDDVEWYIHDYDGIETIHEKHRQW